ncbi:unnamed protein product [Urochloa humidicola]
MCGEKTQQLTTTLPVVLWLLVSSVFNLYRLSWQRSGHYLMRCCHHIIQLPKNKYWIKLFQIIYHQLPNYLCM